MWLYTEGMGLLCLIMMVLTHTMYAFARPEKFITYSSGWEVQNAHVSKFNTPWTPLNHRWHPLYSHMVGMQRVSHSNIFRTWYGHLLKILPLNAIRFLTCELEGRRGHNTQTSSVSIKRRPPWIPPWQARLSPRALMKEPIMTSWELNMQETHGDLKDCILFVNPWDVMHSRYSLDVYCANVWTDA